MNRQTALAIAALLWAAIYLPGLGFPELKGEEPRRALPAISMLETGNWLVPRMSGRPYLSKPPLVNWLIALSMKATGEQAEWAVRLPSVLAMLALALALVWTGSRWLTPAGGFTAAVFVLASVAFVEKGRLAEIEADYVALTGIAFAWWLAAWVKRETGWRLWLVPGIFLGLGLLAKGPTHLLLFYAVVVPVLIRAREWRQLRSAAHLGALTLAILILAAWWIPYHRATAGLGAERVWLAQIGGRVGVGGFGLKGWLLNLPRAFGVILPLAIANGLPWLLFAPLWWNRRVIDALGAKEERLRLLVAAARWPLAILYAGLMVLPGMHPRYTLPLFPAIALLLALAAPLAAPRCRTLWWRINAVLLGAVAVAAAASPWLVKPASIVLNGWALLPAAALMWALSHRFDKPGIVDHEEGPPPDSREQTAVLAAWTAWIVAGGVAVYSIAAMPRMRLEDKLRPIGREVNAAVPAGNFLCVIGRQDEPSLFYVHRKCVFLDPKQPLPPGAEYVLLQKEEWEKSKGRFSNVVEVTHLQTRNGKTEFFLLTLSPAGRG